MSNRNLAEWMETFLASYSQEDDASIVAEASDVMAEEAQEIAHVDEAEQDRREKEAETGYEMSEGSPEVKHFEDGAKVSDKAFKQENERDLTTPEGRYSRAFTSNELKVLGEAISSEILREISSNALTPAEAMLNSEVPLAQLPETVTAVEASLRENGIRRALFSKTRQRLAETLNVTLPIEISVGQPTTDQEDEAGALDFGGDAGGEEFNFEEAPAEEAPAEEEGMESEAMEDMMPMDQFASRKNRFAI